MGSSSTKSNQKEIIIEKGILSETDKSYITSVIQVLYNIKIFRDYLINNEYNENPNKHLNILMKKILEKPLDKINFAEEADEVTKLLRTKYDFIVGKTPGEIMIQILLALKYEEKEITHQNWEEFVFNKQELFPNISNKDKAFQDLLTFNKNHFNTTFSQMFFGVFFAKRKLQSFKDVLYFYNFFCVYELNMPLIYENMINKGKIKLDEYDIPKVNLIDCIIEMQETKSEIFRGENCLAEYYMLSAPTILIFLLKSEDKNIDTPFRGIISFEELSDFSKIIQVNQPNRYKLISIINKEKFKAKKKNKNEVQFMENADDDEKDFYKTIFRNENDQFCEYGKRNSVNNCKLEIDDVDYYHEMLIFMRC